VFLTLFGRFDEAVEAFQNERNPSTGTGARLAKADLAFQALHSDPGFQELLRRINLKP
jgi:hypothetical protein